MPPQKKREKDFPTMSMANGVIGGTTAIPTPLPVNGSVESTNLISQQQEQELFLQAFEKPTQIYRYLRDRQSTHPIFTYRTLGYMKDRMSRNHKGRAGFKIESILGRVEEKAKTSTNYVNIIFYGLSDKSRIGEQWWDKGDMVSVDSKLFKITKSKRKESTTDFAEIFRQTSSVIYNSNENGYPSAGVSIPAQFMHDPHIIFKLVFSIKPTLKYRDTVLDANGVIDEKPNIENNKLFGSDMVIFEKSMGIIAEGMYDITIRELKPMSIKSFSPKKRTWETFSNDYAAVFDEFLMLKCRVVWSSNQIPCNIDSVGLHEFVKNLTAPPENRMVDHINTDDRMYESLINDNNNCIKQSNDIKMTTVKKEKIEIVYNFIYSNNTRQQTEITSQLTCPWCGLDCVQLYALLKHLKLCHARFSFAYQSTAEGARIDVTINDGYDASYAGSPYDFAGPSGSSFARPCGPVRVTSVTELLLCRPRRSKMCLDEFMFHDEDDFGNQRQYITGHKRLYHHTETCLPVHPKGLDFDSEGESDPLWLRQKTIQMIDEFSDVNEGEKELMKLWNLHVMKNGYVGDCQLPLACEMFLDKEGYNIIEKNLYRNFILHICSLFDYGLLSPESVYKIVQKLQSMLSKHKRGLAMMSQHREMQLKYWLDVGIHKQDEQKLKSPQKQLCGAKSANDISAANTLDHKPMHPPAKRLANAIKRASMHPQNINAGDKMINSGNIPVKSGVAKKSALQENETREKRAETLLKRSSNSSTTGVNAERNDKNRSTAEIKSHGAKRRLSNKGSPLPANKRNRSHSIQTNNETRSASKQDGKYTITTQSLNVSSVSSTSTLPKRLVTRRQTISTEAMTAIRNTKATHALRTRLSVPGTKIDKR